MCTSPLYLRNQLFFPCVRPKVLLGSHPTTLLHSIMASNKRLDKDVPSDKLTRIAIVDGDKCKPKKCRQECKKSCPVVKMGKQCIEVEPTSVVAYISEPLCIGCNICVKKCPFEAISIINLPKNLDKEVTHRYGPNSFKLHRLPLPRSGQVLGLVGINGIGKSTALKVLAGKLKPNLGNFNSPPEWTDILSYYRGNELQNYFTKLLEDNLKATIKIQYVESIAKTIKGEVKQLLTSRVENGNLEEMVSLLDLENIMGRDVKDLSGGELQRFAIAVVCVKKADVYMFDEPSSYLDIRQRLHAAVAVRSMVKDSAYVIVVEHDLAVLDYMSDFICCLYGTPGIYGVITAPFSVREGINIFLSGFIPTENLRFRDHALSFKVATNTEEDEAKQTFKNYSYPAMSKTQGSFKLDIEEGQFTDSEIIVMLGQNGCGKSTYIKMLAGFSKADDPETKVPELNVSYKPQMIVPKSEGTVRDLFLNKIRMSMQHPQFISDVMKPMKIEEILDQEISHLSGGELQRVAIVLALGKPADIYLIDEPSAYLDAEQRIITAKVIKRFILHAKKTAFVVEHDFIMATYLADRVILYTGIPAVACIARTPQALLTGMNAFLKDLDVTFRRDPSNYRPRINKLNSVLDREQKAAGTYFFTDADD